MMMTALEECVHELEGHPGRVQIAAKLLIQLWQAALQLGVSCASYL